MRELQVDLNQACFPRRACNAPACSTPYARLVDPNRARVSAGASPANRYTLILKSEVDDAARSRIDGEHYFVRCVLRYRSLDAPASSFAAASGPRYLRQTFSFTSKRSTATSRTGSDLGSGGFRIAIKGCPDTLNLKCRVHPQGERMRPLIELESIDHPLVREAEHGIGVDRLVEIYRTHGHTMGVAATNFH